MRIEKILVRKSEHAWFDIRRRVNELFLNRGTVFAYFSNPKRNDIQVTQNKLQAIS